MVLFASAGTHFLICVLRYGVFDIDDVIINTPGMMLVWFLTSHYALVKQDKILLTNA